jgi:hypothetical protein
MTTLFRVEGKMSTFGGPKDTGMSTTEGLSLFSSEQDMINHGVGDFLLSSQAAGATGLGRRLDPKKYYLACRWWETNLSKSFLRKTWAWVENSKTGARFKARPVDSGPAGWTNRVADLSPGLADALKLKTNEICSVTITDDSSEFGATFDHTPSSASPLASGPRIFTTAEWGARPPKVSYFPKKAAVGIVVHNTEGANRSANADPEQERQAAFANARSIQNSHMDARGWSDTGQHFTISQGGMITEGRHGTLDAAVSGLVVRGAHAPGANDEWWGIEIAGDNRNDYVVTTEQWKTLVILCRWLNRLAGSGLQIEPHDNFVSTTCPGKIKDRLEALRSAVSDES